MLILDCLRRVCEIAAISISHPPPVPVSPALCVDVCVCGGGQWAQVIIALRCHPTPSIHPSVSLISS